MSAAVAPIDQCALAAHCNGYYMSSDKPQINQQNATVEQQNPAQRPIYIALGYAGLLPFALSLGVILAAAVSGPGVHSAALFGLYAPYVFIAYSACILSFLSGAVWRDNTAEHGAASLLIISNVLAVLAWLCLLAIQVSQMLTLLAIAVLMSGYLMLLWAERMVPEVDDRYTAMRVKLTAWVVAMHLLILVCLAGDI